MGKDKYLPHCLGHEAVGQIVMTGPGVKKVKAKDKVVIHWMKGSGIESDTPELFYKNKKINAGLCTTVSEYSILSENRLTKVKISKIFKLYSLYGCVASTELSVFLTRRVKPYHKVAIVE